MLDSQWLAKYMVAISAPTSLRTGRAVISSIFIFSSSHASAAVFSWQVASVNGKVKVDYPLHVVRAWLEVWETMSRTSLSWWRCCEVSL